jgi:hypothetical protein
VRNDHPDPIPVPRKWDYHENDVIPFPPDVILRRLARPPGELLTFARLVWPDLILFRDYVFFADGFSLAAYERWEQSDHGRKHGMRGIAAGLNHRHLSDILTGCRLDALQPTTVEALGGIVTSCWATRFRTAFPEREFTFELGDAFWVWEGPPTNDRPEQSREAES